MVDSVSDWPGVVTMQWPSPLPRAHHGVALEHWRRCSISAAVSKRRGERGEAEGEENKQEKRRRPRWWSGGKVEVEWGQKKVEREQKKVEREQKKVEREQIVHMDAERSLGTPEEKLFPTHTLLSFPPDARSWWSGDHLSPQTSWVCPWSLRVGMGGMRGSHCWMVWSLLPEQRMSPFQESEPVWHAVVDAHEKGSSTSLTMNKMTNFQMVHTTITILKHEQNDKVKLRSCMPASPTLPVWPLMLQVFFSAAASQICTRPKCVPTARYWPWMDRGETAKWISQVCSFGVRNSLQLLGAQITVITDGEQIQPTMHGAIVHSK